MWKEKKMKEKEESKKILTKYDGPRFKPSTLLLTGFVFSFPELTSMAVVGVLVFIFYVYFQYI